VATPLMLFIAKIFDAVKITSITTLPMFLGESTFREIYKIIIAGVGLFDNIKDVEFNRRVVIC
jgi:hypothetical protein